MFLGSFRERRVSYVVYILRRVDTSSFIKIHSMEDGCVASKSLVIFSTQYNTIHQKKYLINKQQNY